MICKHCGLEYPDDLEACPGCGTPNEDVEAQVMSAEERDAFDGMTIETGTEEETRGDWKVYDQEDIRRQQEKAAKKEKWRSLWELVKLNSRLVLAAAAVILAVVLLLPTLVGFLLVGLGALLVWTFFRNFFIRW
ncbi:hypothetical protein VOI45_04825 [Acidaminococcus fermentans]|uniref:hypothetical protein n=1 Tax=Acidaminococcus fermentans TaxID=905 RepID=UPI002E766B0B|nr:hypothetical protein [Acidaminococcus fermentans]MEE1598108.1 hypothetical protein [Acidaminococcus fermentans]MEE4122370.1 hypothetical protein [Acidaminococcus fermentans]